MRYLSAANLCVFLMFENLFFCTRSLLLLRCCVLLVMTVGHKQLCVFALMVQNKFPFGDSKGYLVFILKCRILKLLYSGKTHKTLENSHHRMSDLKEINFPFMCPATSSLLTSEGAVVLLSKIDQTKQDPLISMFECGC